MTDLHTHILPGMDDGAGTTEDSIEMLLHEHQQGIDTVVLTPHFYPEQESIDAFLLRRQDSWEQLKQAVNGLAEDVRSNIPHMVLGAEVAYLPKLEEYGDLRPLCIGNTSNMLLELPFYPWDKMFVHQLYVFLERVGVTPILAHIERYFPCQNKRHLNEILELGLPVQVGIDMLSGRMSLPMKLLKQGKVHVVASDCHDMCRRRPDLGIAMETVKKKLGFEWAEELEELADQLAVGQ